MKVHLKRVPLGDESLHIYAVMVDFRYWGIATMSDTFTGMRFKIVLMSPFKPYRCYKL